MAGESSRLDLGIPKQLLDVAGRSMARVVVDSAVTSSLDRVVAVTGRAADEVTASLAGVGAVVAHNPDYRTGNVSSLLAGVADAGSFDAAMVLLGDMPEVDTAVIDTITAAWRAHRPWAAYAVYDDGRPNHPFVLSSDAVAVVRATPGSKPLWRLLVTDPPHAVLAVPVARPVPVDVDTVADYDRLLGREERLA
ncbi:MAG: NTP transferase domain-containing protein [Actinomycetota bacterium]|nr:NTP transferase domain-containing protein [Actinomycetota bacterium]